MTSRKSEKVKKVSRSRVILSQVLACLALDFLLIGLGMSISFVTMVLPEVMDAKEGLSIDQTQASWFGSMAFLFQPLGSIFSGPLLDYFGRKKALLLVNIPHLVAWLLMYFAWNVPSLFVGNALLGLGTGIMEAPSVTYVGEVTDPSLRGCLTTLTNGFTFIGIFIAYLLGTVLPWKQAALVSLTVPLATMALVLLVPETPIWLLSKGRQKEALLSLCRLRGWAEPEDVKKEFEELLQYNEHVTQCVICVKEGNGDFEGCDHLNCGIVKRIVLKFKHTFFVKETIRPFTLVVVGAVFIPMNLISATIVKMIGKRKLVIGSLLATALSSLSIGIYARIKLPSTVFSYEPSTFPEPNEILPVVLFMALVCFTSLGIPWILLSEVFPFKSRGMATGLAAAFNYLIVFVITKTNYNLESSFHISGTFALYGILTIIGTVYIYLFLPETENKTLAEIETYYKGDQKIFADDFLINALIKKRDVNFESNKPMLVS
ncbi:facilitated trehalose transporter Tret1-like isoform X2 [Battus philenor]|uniref:facilitated trehalose transporter Tret1-like isoform X2 n=1 Tax=Battus philenor TaxID=42288 RepID=UPI0035D02AF7